MKSAVLNEKPSAQPDRGIAVPAGKMSFEEFLEWADEDTHAEWVDGKVLLMSPVSIRHQRVGGFIYSLFTRYLESHPIGELLYESFQMKTGPDLPSREPDIIFLANEHADRIRDTYLQGPGDLVVEIISMDSRSRDRGDKFYEYEQGGVSEYWLIDPLRGRTEFYYLDKTGAYASVPLDANGYYLSKQLPGLKLLPEWLWQDPLPLIPSILGDAGIVAA
jgi:Uma2 family endonuclease